MALTAEDKRERILTHQWLRGHESSLQDFARAMRKKSGDLYAAQKWQDASNYASFAAEAEKAAAEAKAKHEEYAKDNPFVKARGDLEAKRDE